MEANIKSYVLSIFLGTAPFIATLIIWLLWEISGYRWHETDILVSCILMLLIAVIAVELYLIGIHVLVFFTVKQFGFQAIREDRSLGTIIFYVALVNMVSLLPILIWLFTDRRNQNFALEEISVFLAILFIIMGFFIGAIYCWLIKKQKAINNDIQR
ncbi:hypothetical protein N5853_13720 (plasmid) [Bartonella sp. HY329]|uniref:hypothetical protein n=1 Tax=unclassified Bartonella TaxID=2645622 RepID=UPI0021CAC8A5|nr:MULTISPECIES: hypothetical protein [unclassified Bartonella]UXM96590.1 hypothetical protein N5853_13720 [Bartonella sp. HY329]UXN10913.1 hypothetical protein N5852_13725 [Bartonella sp. HY328]